MVIGELIELLEKVRDKHDAQGLHDDTLWIEVAAAEPGGPRAYEITGVTDVENSGGMEWTVWIGCTPDTHITEAPSQAIPGDRWVKQNPNAPRGMPLEDL